jgi:hypothetical protein
VLYDNQPEALVSSEGCHVVVITSILTEWLENFEGNIGKYAGGGRVEGQEGCGDGVSA